MNVTILDPSNYTPYYCDRLCASLAPRLNRLALVTSRYSWDDFHYRNNYEIRYHFYRFSGRFRAHRLRPVLKALEHPVDLARFLLLVRHLRVDVVHFQWALLPPLDLLAIAALKRMGIAVVYTAHDILPHARFRGDAVLYGALYKAVDHIIVHTETNAADLARRHGIDRGKISVIPLGLFLEDEPLELSRDEARRTLRLGQGKVIVLFFGNVRRHKGLEVLLEAFDRLHCLLPETRLVIAGKLQYDLPDSIRMRNGVITDFRYVPHGEALLYYDSADLVVLPYLTATQSAVLFTALGRGCPVIVTDVGGLGETVRAANVGLVVPPADADELFKAMYKVLSDPLLLGELRRRVIQWRNQADSWDQIASSTLDVYRKALGRRDSRR